MRTVRRSLRIALAALLVAVAVAAQELDPTELIDTPTASVAPHASYDTSLRLYAEGGVLLRLRVGLRDALHFGFSFGGTRLLGTGDPDWNPRVEFNIKGQLLRESFAGPAVAIGYDSQGYGAHDGETNRYQVKSRGFYAVASKHFLFVGDLGLHGGINYSLERDDDDDEANFFFGVEKSLHPALDLLVEYDAATNDNLDNGLFGEGKGYLNAALLWRVSEALSLEFDFRNLIENGESGAVQNDPSDWRRELKIVYVDYF